MALIDFRDKTFLALLVLTSLFSGFVKAETFQQIQARATRGDSKAQFQLGEAYRDGWNVKKDYKIAASWYRKAAESGNAEAQRRLGLCHLSGTGVAKDLKTALQWLHAAAKHNDTEAQIILGVILSSGMPFENQFGRPIDWLRKAANRGSAEAAASLGSMLLSEEESPATLAEAVRWLEMATERGIAGAQVCLGVCYQTGTGVHEDQAKAKELYRQAARQGSFDAKVILIALGESIPEDDGTINVDLGGKRLSIPIPSGFERADSIQQRLLAANMEVFGGDDLLPVLLFGRDEASSDVETSATIRVLKPKMEKFSRVELSDWVELTNVVFRAGGGFGIGAFGGGALSLGSGEVDVRDSRFGNLVGGKYAGAFSELLPLTEKRQADDALILFVGFALIGRQVFVVQAMHPSSSLESDVHFRQSVETFLKRFTDQSSNRATSPKTTTTPKLDAPRFKKDTLSHDLLDVGPIKSKLPPMISPDSIDMLMKSNWNDQKTLGEEKSLGLDLMVSYPATWICKPGRGPHVLYHIREKDPELTESGRLFSSIPYLQVLVMSADPHYVQAIFEVATSDDEELQSEVAKGMCENGWTLLGFGRTNTSVAPAFWLTYCATQESLGFKIAQIVRSFYVPFPNGRLLMLSFGVSRTLHPEQREDKSYPVEDFRRFLPIGMKFVTLMNILDNSQRYNPERIQGNTTGTAWFVTRKELVTCLHVVSDAKRVFFQDETGSQVLLDVIAKDAPNDLALLRVRNSFISCPSPIRIETTPPNKGSEVVVVGFPFSDMLGMEPKVTSGVISSSAGLLSDESRITMTAPVQPGNSGGPLLDMRGRVVGVVDSRLIDLLPDDDVTEKPQNINFAVKANAVVRLLEKARVKQPTFSGTGKQYSSPAGVFKRVKPAIVLLQAE